jgi:hypothetical protein
MPAVVPDDSPRTVRVSQKELADMLGVSAASVSAASKNMYYCQGYDVWNWAVQHPAGNVIEGYEVPVQVMKEKLPKSEWTRYGIFDNE